MAIDDKYEQIEKQYAVDSPNQVLDLSLKALGMLPGIGPLVSLADSLKTHFSHAEALSRINALLGALIEDVKRHTNEITDINTRLGRPEFVRVFHVAATEAVFMPDLGKIRDFGKLLGDAVRCNETDQLDEYAAFIRDLAQLTRDDIEVLELIGSIQGRELKQSWTTSDYNNLAATVPRVLAEVDRRHVQRNEFYSHVFRLTGFGLVMPINWNQSAWGPQDQGFAITIRGKRLTDIISNQMRTAAQR